MKSDITIDRHLLKPKDFALPILDKLNDMAVKMVGMRLVVVYPTDTGLDQVLTGSGNTLNQFCKLIQGSKTGAEHCRMCHLVMTRSSRTNTTTVQQCHTGATALVKLVSGEQDTSLAVLSSCCFTDQTSISPRAIARRSGKALGIDENALAKASQDTVRLDPEKLKIATLIMDIAGEALKLILDRIMAEAALEKERRSHIPEQAVMSEVKNALQQAASTLHEAKTPQPRIPSTLPPGASAIDVISELVAGKPYLPFSLRTVSASVQITANHFSQLFHKRHGVCFLDFLTEHRIKYSKLLLKNLSLNIAQVALSAGFHDAGYFTRRFKQKTGLTPREWRRKLERA